MKTKYFFSTLSQRANTALLLASLSLLPSAVVAQQTSLSEVLEQGVYSEETKGDVDGAMKLYEQVVADAKASRTLAAQAQYRIGVCLYKKKSYPEATAAFEKFVKDFPDQKDLVAKANEYLAGATALLPAPWADGEDLRYDVRFPSGFKLGVARYSVSAGELNGRKIWRLNSQLYAGVQQWSRTEVEADSFKPIHSRWKHSLIGDSETTYSTNTATVKLKGKDEVKKVDLDGAIYDNEEAVELWRCFPLANGYKTEMRVLTGLGGGNIVGIKLDVTGPEKVTVPAGTFDCFKVDLNIKQTFWYSADEHRYLVKFEAGGVVVELKSIEQRKPDEPVNYRDASLGFSLTLPSNWIIDRNEKADEKGKTAFLILDSEAVAITQMHVESLDTLTADQKKSPRAWADAKVADASKSVKDFKVRDDSWKELTVAGKPAVSVVADCTQGTGKNVLCGVYVFGEKNATEFWFMVPADDYDNFRPKFDAVVASYKMN